MGRLHVGVQWAALGLRREAQSQAGLATTQVSCGGGAHRERTLPCSPWPVREEVIAELGRSVREECHERSLALEGDFLPNTSDMSHCGMD